MIICKFKKNISYNLKNTKDYRTRFKNLLKSSCSFVAIVVAAAAAASIYLSILAINCFYVIGVCFCKSL